MIAARVLRRWHWVHKWTSVFCTLFLLLLCVTGFPLIFHEEIDGWLSDDPPYEALPAETSMANLDAVVDAAKRLYPGEFIRHSFIDDDEPRIIVALGPRQDSLPREVHGIYFDARTGKILKEVPPMDRREPTFTGVMLKLHSDLFIDLPGELFLGAMGLLFVASIVSGVVLYGPFMRKLSFGAVRVERSKRIKWLDLHNLLGIAIMAWMLVVGVTGVINELSTPLANLWRSTDVAAMAAPYRGQPMPGRIEPPQAVYDAVRRALPHNEIVTLVFPGNPFGSPYHYIVWTRGDTPLTARLFNPVLVDAGNGAIAGMAPMPWYLRALQMSRPLHFGDYGGLPLKIIWALLDLVSIAVLGSGLYLWFARGRGSIEVLIEETERAEAIAAGSGRS